MSETQPGPRSPAWKTCEINKVEKNRKRRAPVEENSKCKQRVPYADRCGPPMSTKCRMSVPRTHSSENSILASPRQASVRGLAAYHIGSKMGRGNYGVVYKAEHLPTNTLVAIKCLRADPDGEGVPSTTLREISLLRDLNHPNIIRLRELVCDGTKIFAIFDYAREDLSAYIRRHRTDEEGIGRQKSKVFLSQLLSSLEYCHANRVMHRDLKPANILVTDGQIKLADFGLARTFTPGSSSALTHEVVTLWYRAPEILLGAGAYTSAVDMWSVGCIFSEMLFGRPLFPGQSELGELFLIFRAMGTPTETSWPGVKKLPHFQTIFPQWDARPARAIWRGLDCAYCCDVLQKLLRCAPSARVTARELCRHPLFGANENLTTAP